MSARDPNTSVIVSNGSEFFRIESSDLEEARADGFYLPSERGLTIVSNGNELFEIPLEDVAEAAEDGFHDLLSADAPSPEATIPARPTATVAKAVDSEFAAGSPLFLIPEFDLAERILPAATVQLDEVVDEDEERRNELRTQLEASTGFDRWELRFQLYRPTGAQLRRLQATYGASTILHVIALFVLSLFFLVDEQPADGAPVISSVVSSDVPDEQFEEEEDTPELEFDSLEETAEPEMADAAGEIEQDLGIDAVESLTAASPVSFGGGLDGLAEGIQKTTKTPAVKKSAKFFGSKQVASRFVFVIDNSNSMTKGRFETALNELAKTIVQLNSAQSYHIVFYSDTAYPLFYPRTYRGMIPASDENKQLTLRWLTTIQLCLYTNAADALRIAYALKPDTIFVLGDGVFTDSRDVRLVMSQRDERSRKVKIHALGMEVDQRGSQNFQLLADETGGTYRDVGVHPRGLEIAMQRPRPRNKKPNGIWGLTIKPKQ